MFCYQCEQTARGEGCGKSGVCGKQPDVAALQDLLVYALTGLAQAATVGRKAGIRDRAADVFTCEALFATITNVDFNPERFPPLIRRSAAYRDGAKPGRNYYTEFVEKTPADCIVLPFTISSLWLRSSAPLPGASGSSLAFSACGPVPLSVRSACACP